MKVAPRLLALAVPHGPERPGTVEDLAVMLRVEDAVAGDVAAIDRGVLRVHMEDHALAFEHLGRLHDVDSLPEQVARIEVGADLGADGLRGAAAGSPGL
jgi:hypothetical protein